MPKVTFLLNDFKFDLMKAVELDFLPTPGMEIYLLTSEEGETLTTVSHVVCHISKKYPFGKSQFCAFLEKFDLAPDEKRKTVGDELYISLIKDGWESV